MRYLSSSIASYPPSKPIAASLASIFNSSPKLHVFGLLYVYPKNANFFRSSITVRPTTGSRSSLSLGRVLIFLGRFIAYDDIWGSWSPEAQLGHS